MFYIVSDELELNDSEEDDPDDDIAPLLANENLCEDLINDDENQEENEEDQEEIESPWKKWNIGDPQPSFEKYLFDSDYVGFNAPENRNLVTPLDFFDLLSDDEILESIVLHTNQYAQQRKQQNTPLTKNSIWAFWKDLTVEEFKAFLGVINNMALNHKPNLNDYFSNSWLDKQPFFKDVFSRIRFSMIYWNLQIAFPDAGIVRGATSKSHKVRLFLKRLESNFKKFYTPQKYISIDEYTIGFKGRVSFRVYNKDKPTKWGIKVYALGDAQNGYMFSMEPYFGAQTTNALMCPELPTTARVVIHLANNLTQVPNLGIGYHIFIDRYYSSIILAETLSAMKMHVTGTVMTNRKGLPSDVKSKKKIKQGESLCFSKDNMGVTVWKDKRPVAMLSNYYDFSTESLTRKSKKNGVWEDETITKPLVICEYNRYMGGRVG